MSGKREAKKRTGAWGQEVTGRKEGAERTRRESDAENEVEKENGSRSDSQGWKERGSARAARQGAGIRRNKRGIFVPGDESKWREADFSLLVHPPTHLRTYLPYPAFMSAVAED